MSLRACRCREELPPWRRLGRGVIGAGAAHARWFGELVAFGWDVALLGREAGRGELAAVHLHPAGGAPPGRP